MTASDRLEGGTEVGTARRYGVDTSILVRLIAQEPRADFERCLTQLGVLVDERGCEIFASNQAIGEAYAALIHHYSLSSADAKAGLRSVLISGLIAPQNGPAVLEALAATSNPGLFDRLIAIDYERAGMDTLTLDRQMASLRHVRLVAE